MSSLTETIREELMVTNKEFQRLHQQHAHYDAELARLSAKKFLNEDDQVKETELKKLKLWTKDQMERIIHNSRSG